MYSSGLHIQQKISRLMDFALYQVLKLTILRHIIKYKCVFDPVINRNIIQNINSLEKNILNKNIVKGKTPKFSIADQLQCGFVKVFLENNSVNRNDQYILLKISGIWESTHEYGVTFKFIVLNHQL